MGKQGNRSRIVLWLVLVLSGTLSLSSCLLAPSKTASPLTESVAKKATRLLKMEAKQSAQGIVIALAADGALSYDLTKLDDPPRLLLTFPELRLEPTIQPILLNFPEVTGLFPAEEGEKGSRLEVVLRQTEHYTLLERADGLDLTIPSNGEKSVVPEEGANESLRLSHDAEGTQIHLLGSAFLSEPQSFRVENPPRLILDFKVENSSFSPKQTVQKFPQTSPELKEVYVAYGAGKARVVMELADATVMFSVHKVEGRPVVYLSHSGNQNKELTVPQVEAVGFSRDGNDSLLTLQMNTAAVVLDSQTEGEGLIVTLLGTRLADSLSYHKEGGKRMDVRAFGGPVNTVDIYREGEDTQIMVSMTGAANQHDILQQGNTILLRIKPAETQGTEGAKSAYAGEKISMDFKDIDIQNALRLLAEMHHLNILTSDSVNGTLTMRLVEVPWDQALDMILEAKGLGKVLQGNVLRVAPLQEIQSMAEARLKAQKSNQQLEAITTEMLPVSFAKASEIRTLLMEGDQDKGTRLLSQSGSVSIDQRTNTLIVKDMVSNQILIREMVGKLDKPIPQVLIEARIVEVQRDSSMSLGINWGFNYKGGPDSHLGISSTALNAYQVQQDVTGTQGRRPLMSSDALPMNVNLMPVATTGRLGAHLGSISPLVDLDIELGALESGGKAKTISSPRVLTTDNQAASIRQGTRQPYLTQAEGGGTTYEYIEAALSLNVTPHVTANGFITLEVVATNNSPGTGSPPPINTKEVQTQALVKNGQTIVLGGIFQNTQTDSQAGIPELSKIPYFGWLFKNKATSTIQTELLIFITPRIVNPS